MNRLLLSLLLGITFHEGQRMKIGEKLHFVGIFSGGLSDTTGGKISLVVPLSYLWGILESEGFVKYQKTFERK